MKSTTLLLLLTVSTAAIATDTVPNSIPPTVNPPVDLRPPVANPDVEFWRSNLTPSPLGLRPQFASSGKDGIELPFGINYNREAKSLLMPIDQKNEWGVGLNLNVNSSKALELAPASSSLGLQPKRTPGVMLQRKF